MPSKKDFAKFYLDLYRGALWDRFSIYCLLSGVAVGWGRWGAGMKATESAGLVWGARGAFALRGVSRERDALACG